ncbi:hypothetical protein CEUSTIGMA_g9537.t1 [Chlamydomonas eustigma]|uniref:Hexosyltransferase n=1 Tax=Chlamydomonas eustigma TaxID=1157962 RepID=A0A250XGS0_9CHLO|nr:hypothetical protein CEUSTIGMA_g9537.t1 [Chlamydomonas eustigma]|eukprot:GAX82109.1 hypothetical protein CEUSTIGMA_g9537.t1 [Chlamydomonas eustigma]
MFRQIPTVLIFLLIYGQYPITFSSHDNTANTGYDLNDIVLVVPSTMARLPLVQKTRSWRKGIRTLIATDAGTSAALELTTHFSSSHLETYIHIDDEKPQPNLKPYAKRPGDYRGAQAPFLAHKHFGDTYKWMMYGDDDTLFFLPGVINLIRRFNDMEPLAVTDNLWLMKKHPNPMAPRCLPCKNEVVAFPTFPPHHSNWSTGKESTEVAPTTIAGRLPQSACPECSPRLACATMPLDAVPSSSLKEISQSGIPRDHVCVPSGAHGGAGLLLSAALMRRISYDDAMQCFEGQRGASGSDKLFSRVLQECMNITFTDPGYWIDMYLLERSKVLNDTVSHQFGTAEMPTPVDEPGSQVPEHNKQDRVLGSSLNPLGFFPLYMVFDPRAMKSLLLNAVRYIDHEGCNNRCQWMLSHAVSLHIGARFLPSLERAVEVMHIAAVSHARALRLLGTNSSWGSLPKEKQ